MGRPIIQSCDFPDEDLKVLFHSINEIDDPFYVIVAATTDNYRIELAFAAMPEMKDSLEDLIDYFAAKSDSIKKILYFEVCSLIMADEDIRPEEQQVLVDITRKFEIEPDIIEQINKSVTDLKAVYGNIYRVLSEGCGR